MKEEHGLAPGPADPLGLMLKREYAGLEQSMLPGFDRARKAELKAMYARLPPDERKMLKSIRAQRALDSVDVLHAVIQHEWGNMTASERAIWSRVSTLTNKLRPKLKGAVKFD